MKLFVTSFSPQGYETYGKTFLETFIKFWPKTTRLLVYFEGEQPPIEDPRISYIDLDEDPDRAAFVARHGDDPGKNGIFYNEDGTAFANYRFQAIRFAHKVFALTDFARQPETDWLIWIDSDVVTTSRIPDDFFDFLDHRHLATYLGRKDWPHSECGFVAFSLTHPKGGEFLATMRQAYVEDHIFGLAEWHDSFLFDHLRQQYEAEGQEFFNLSKDLPGLNVWPATILGQHLIHLKGPEAKGHPTKPTHLDLFAAMQTCANRYQQIPMVINALRPRVIVEVGSWDCEHAIQMAICALRHRDHVTYHGYDLFEDATAETDLAEKNVKRHATLAEATERLETFKAQNPGFEYHLTKGNTRDTLLDVPPEIDFVFLDGGHSVETIRNDYEALKHAKIVLFDDFYHEGADTTTHGCNEVVKDIEHAILPVVDTFAASGLKIGMAIAGPGVVNVKDEPTAPADKKSGKLDIITKNCTEDSTIHANIRHAMAQRREAVTDRLRTLQAEIAALKRSKVTFLPGHCKRHKSTAIIVGGDEVVTNAELPEHQEMLEKLRLHAALGHDIFAVKSSHDILLKAGIVPFGCLLLDPRPHVQEFVRAPDKRVRYFVASMCDPSVWRALQEAGVPIYAYHAGVNTGEEKVIAELGGGDIVFGGTTAGLRGVNLLYVMGFRKFELYGFASSYRVRPEKAHGKSTKPIYDVTILDRNFVTDPELVAQSKDVETTLKMLPDISLVAHGEGMLPYALELTKANIARERGSRGLVMPAIQPYSHALSAGDAESEAYWIGNAIDALVSRKRKIGKKVRSLPRFEATARRRRR